MRAPNRIENQIVGKIVKQTPNPDDMSSRATALPIREVPMFLDGGETFFEAQIKHDKLEEQRQLEETHRRPAQLSPVPEYSRTARFESYEDAPSEIE